MKSIEHISIGFDQADKVIEILSERLIISTSLQSSTTTREERGGHVEQLLG